MERDPPKTFNPTPCAKLGGSYCQGQPDLSQSAADREQRGERRSAQAALQERRIRPIQLRAHGERLLRHPACAARTVWPNARATFGRISADVSAAGTCGAAALRRGVPHTRESLVRRVERGGHAVRLRPYPRDRGVDPRVEPVPAHAFQIRFGIWPLTRAPSLSQLSRELAEAGVIEPQLGNVIREVCAVCSPDPWRDGYG